MEKKIMSILFRTILITGLALLLSASMPGLQMERTLYDLNMRYLASKSPPSEIVMVMIDEKSMTHVDTEMNGMKWPYPRSFHARVLNHLKSAGARAVYFDIVFNQPSSYGEKDDFIFEETLRKIPTILAGEFNGAEIVPPLSRFMDHGALAGNISTPLDIDHRARNMRNSTPLPMSFSQALSYFCFGLFTKTPARSSLHEPIHTVEQILFSIIYPDRATPSPGFIHYPAASDSIKRVSWIDVFNPELFQTQKNLFKEKIVFIASPFGPSMDQGRKPDIYKTPTSHEPVSGAEIRADTCMTLLYGKTRYLASPAIFSLIFLSWVLLSSVPLTLVRTPFKRFLILLFLSVTLMLLNGSLFHRGWVMPLLPFILFGLLLYGFSIMRWYLGKHTERHLKRLQLRHHMPDETAEWVFTNPDKALFEGEKKVVTLLFLELGGLEAVFESLPPNRVIQSVREYLAGMTTIIQEHGGTVDACRGHEVLAFFGAPLNQENHMDLALKAAGELLRFYSEITLKKENKQAMEFSLRIGIHTGLVVTGNIGAGALIHYTVIGNTVKIAARIKELSFDLHVPVVISGESVNGLKQGIPETLFPVARVAIKGKKEPVNLYTLAEKGTTPLYDALFDYLTLMDQNEYGPARVKLFDLLKRAPDFGPARFHHQKFITDKAPLLDDTAKPYWHLHKE